MVLRVQCIEYVVLRVFALKHDEWQTSRVHLVTTSSGFSQKSISRLED